MPAREGQDRPLDEEVRALAGSEALRVLRNDADFASVEILDVELQIVDHEVVNEDVRVLYTKGKLGQPTNAR